MHSGMNSPFSQTTKSQLCGLCTNGPSVHRGAVGACFENTCQAVEQPSLFYRLCVFAQTDLTARQMGHAERQRVGRRVQCSQRASA